MNRSFSLSHPRHLLSKLQSDIERIRNAATTPFGAQYAALDCASDAWHLTDWVLATVGDEQFRELSGYTRKPNKITQGATDGFRHLQAAKLPKLGACQQISNTGKHLKIKSLDETVQTGKGVRVSDQGRTPTGGAWVDLYTVVQVQFGDELYDADDFFGDAAADWANFLNDLRM